MYKRMYKETAFWRLLILLRVEFSISRVESTRLHRQTWPASFFLQPIEIDSFNSTVRLPCERTNVFRNEKSMRLTYPRVRQGNAEGIQASLVAVFEGTDDLNWLSNPYELENPN